VDLLKKQLAALGADPIELVSLEEARKRMTEAVAKLMQGDEKAEKDVEKWDKAIRLNPDYVKEMEEKAKKWAEDNKGVCTEALKTTRGLVPLDVRRTTAKKMQEKGLPAAVAKRVYEKKILWTVRFPLKELKKIHIVDLRNKFSTQGLDLLEMRAVWGVLSAIDEFESDNGGEKQQWVANFREKLEDMTNKNEKGTLMENQKRHPVYAKAKTKLEDGTEVDLCLFDTTGQVEERQATKTGAGEATEQAKVGTSLKDRMKGMKNVEPKSVVTGYLYKQGKHLSSSWKIRFVVFDANTKTIKIFKDPSAAKQSGNPKPNAQVQLTKDSSVIELKSTRQLCFEVIGEHSDVSFDDEDKDKKDGESKSNGKALSLRLSADAEKEKKMWMDTIQNNIAILRGEKPSSGLALKKTSTPTKAGEPPPPPPPPGKGKGKGGNPMLAAIQGRGRGGGKGGNPLLAGIQARGRGKGGGNGGDLMAALRAKGAKVDNGKTESPKKAGGNSEFLAQLQKRAMETKKS